MKKKLASDGEKIFVFRVFLKDSPEIVRELALIETHTLYNFAEAIVDSFDFDFDHCFGFFDNIDRWYQAEERYELFKDVGEECKPGTKGVKKTKIPGTFEKNNKMLFLFDYGTGWKFVAELVRDEKAAAGSRKKYPRLLRKVGESPEQYPALEVEENNMVN